MRVICPYAGRIEPQTAGALDGSGLPWEPADVSGDDTAYTRLLEHLWAGGGSFALVEHDIVPHAGALEELLGCPRGWCAFPYQLGGIVHAGLGCTRFSAGLLREYPDAVRETRGESTPVHPAGHWCSLDDRLARTLTRAGAARHVHQPPVTHLHPQPSHGCTTLTR